MKIYIEENQIDEYYRKGFNVYLEANTIICVSHDNSNDVDDPRNFKAVYENVKYYVETEGLLN